METSVKTLRASRCDIFRVVVFDLGVHGIRSGSVFLRTVAAIGISLGESSSTSDIRSGSEWPTDRDRSRGMGYSASSPGNPSRPGCIHDIRNRTRARCPDAENPRNYTPVNFAPKRDSLLARLNYFRRPTVLIRKAWSANKWVVRFDLGDRRERWLLNGISCNGAKHGYRGSRVESLAVSICQSL